MKRSKPMRRTAFKPKAPPRREATQSTATPRPRPRPVARAAAEMPMATPVPKAKPWRSEPYRRLVAGDPCEHCGIVGYSQCAHSDTGKGMGMKTGDETCYALCGPHPGLGSMMVEGCHEIIGRRLTREQRRPLEAFYAQRTRDRHRPECEKRGILLPPEKHD